MDPNPFDSAAPANGVERGRMQILPDGVAVSWLRSKKMCGRGTHLDALPERCLSTDDAGSHMARLDSGLSLRKMLCRNR